MSICDSVRRWFCGAPERPAPVPSQEPVVPALSPARLLAESLTSPETRDEWKRTWRSGISGYGVHTYNNESRQITIRRSFFYGTSISTPFTLTSAEERIVGAALDKFDRREREIEEALVLSRLTAPIEQGAKKPRKAKSAA